MKENAIIAVLYSSGGLGDVGRHAVRAALDAGQSISKIKVLSRDPSTLGHPRWGCGCPEDHVFTDEELKKVESIQIDVTKEDLAGHLGGVDAVVSCLGNRQPFLDDNIGKEGTEHVVKAMLEAGVERLVVISSPGVEEDWPPVEWTWEGRVLAGVFTTICRANYRDLCGVERAVRAVAADWFDYLIVRPVGVSEDVTPEGKWYVQNKKGEDTLGVNMAKLDCARFMVHEALEPSMHRTAVVVGSKPGASPRHNHKFSVGIGKLQVPLPIN